LPGWIGTFAPIHVFSFGVHAPVAIRYRSACMSPAEKQKQQEALQAQLDQVTALSAEKDTLLQAVAENARLMNEINAEVAKVKDLKAGVSPVVGAEGGEAVLLDLRGCQSRSHR